MKFEVKKQLFKSPFLYNLITTFPLCGSAFFFQFGNKFLVSYEHWMVWPAVFV